jgi:hypothetical protein
MSDAPEGWFAIAGMIVGWLAAVITFIAVYIAAVGSVGWVIGIALGWIPAGLAAGLAYLLFRYLWWLAAIGVVMIILNLIH